MLFRSGSERGTKGLVAGETGRRGVQDGGCSKEDRLARVAANQSPASSGLLCGEESGDVSFVRSLARSSRLGAAWPGVKGQKLAPGETV